MKMKHIVVLTMTATLVFSLAACGSAPQEEQPAAEPEVAVEEVAEEPEAEPSIEEEISVEEEAVVAEEEVADEAETDAIMPVASSYEELIEIYQTAFEEEWDSDQLLANGLSTLMTYAYGNGIDSIGFSPACDIDHDGQYELLIGEMYPVDSDNEPDKIVYAAYTIKDDQVVPICISSERDRYYLMDLLDNPGEALNFAREGSNSAFNSFNAEYRLENADLILCQAIVYDSEFDEENPWYMSYDEDFNYENAEAITDQEAFDIIESYQMHYYYPGYLGISQGYFMPDPECAE